MRQDTMAAMHGNVTSPIRAPAGDVSGLPALSRSVFCACLRTVVVALTLAAGAAQADRLVNVSTRGQVGTGDNVLIGGFIIEGSGTKNVIIRARGPSFAGEVPGSLVDPSIRLTRVTGEFIAENNNWQDDAAHLAIPVHLRPTTAAEAALNVDLEPGLYTPIVTGIGGTGIGIIEVFETDDTNRLTNVSTRGLVGTGDEVLIGGFIIEGDASKTVVIRARGPSFAADVPGALADPEFRLNRVTGEFIANNNNWRDDPAHATIPAHLQPTNDNEAALIVTLEPGAYTPIVSGVGGTTGIAIVEVFEIDAPTPEAADARALFETEVSGPVVGAVCVNCHVEGGASAFTRLVFVHEANPDHLNLNYSTLETFIGGDAANAELVLSKVQGGSGHGGGAVLAGHSTQFNSLLRTLCALASFPRCADVPTETATLYTEGVATPIVEDNCSACHVAEGVSGFTRLVFRKQADADHLAQNYNQFVNFVGTDPANAQLILSKVTGGSGHGGGTRFGNTTPEYAALEAFLCGLAPFEECGVVQGGEGIFQNVSLADAAEVYRRAALVLGGRRLDAATLAALQGAGDDELRAAIRDLMAGPEFKEFLITGANDRLLTDKYLYESVIDDQNRRYVNYANRLFDLRLQDSANDEDTAREWRRRTSFGIARAPLELIAHVVQNEKPYTEILTADYTMLNPDSNFALGGDASFVDPDDMNDFQPGHVHGYFRDDDSKQVLEVQNVGTQVLSPGNLATSYPHAGILNTQVFLRRYPSTATNRNRARARWTYYHFLGFDIERSAARTADPDALRDNDNPTMNNPACIVCHTTMDPVAGAYQNYGDDGDYRDQWGGNDSLDGNYKYDRDSPYRDGDTWYRDMRAPGIAGTAMPTGEGERGLQWLAREIADDPAFGPASVRFWWHSVMGNEPLNPPGERGDVNFDEDTRAFSDQDSEINRIAARFALNQGHGAWNLKDMLTDLIMSEWFRAAQLVNPTEVDRIQLRSAGTEKLLTPEQLTRKTRTLTGITWRNRQDWRAGQLLPGLHNEYSLYYGGIDSDGVTQRIREVTATMLSVANTHAVEVSCPIVLKEFILPEGSRRLFNGIDRHLTPDVEVSGEFLVTASHPNDAEIAGDTWRLRGATYDVRIAYSNDFWDIEQGDRNLNIDKLTVRDTDGNPVVEVEMEDLTPDVDPGCANVRQAGSVRYQILYHSCTFTTPIELPASGDYQFEVSTWGDQAGPGLPVLQLAVVARGNLENTTGSLRLRRKLAEMHRVFWGENVDVDDPSVMRSYHLLVETWLAKQSLEDRRFPRNRCNWYDDMTFFDDLPIDGDPVDRDTNGNLSWTNAAWSYVGREFDDRDPTMMLETWSVMIAWFLSDYRYLYL